MSSPSPAQRLGPYELIEQIGKGGMGEVWRARDPRLGRNVAIKISAQQFSDRFEREARTIASLNHSNICHLYDVGPNYLVMELIEGPTLADRIKEGPIALDEALQIAKQIADALETAHEKGIVHRDLKPANVKVKQDGSVKVLDFGLATSAVQNSSVTPDSPTMLSAVGMIIGTAAYMAPEQARGKVVDKRADIWAFGVVVYEMITGKRLFEGEDVVETLAAVVHKEPDLTAVPANVRRLLERCLAKDPNKRLRDISGVELLLEASQTATVPLAPITSRIAWIIAAAAIASAAAVSVVHYREAPAVSQTLRSTIPSPEGTVHSFAISPDGRNLVIAVEANGKRQLWLRPMDGLQPQPMAFTEGAVYPFWSPDSHWVAFFADNKLKKIEVTGGAAQSICDATDPRGGTWNRDGVIVISPGVRLSRVSSTGGVPVNLTEGRAEERHAYFLPDGQHFIYVVRNGPAGSNGLHVRSLDGRSDTRIVPDISSGVYAPAAAGAGYGQILFYRDATLMALPFNLRSLRSEGDPRPVVDQFALTTNVTYVPVSVSETGLLVYEASAADSIRLDWVDRSGNSLGAAGEPGKLHVPALSPDEKALAFERQFGGSAASYAPATSIWIRDLIRGTETRVTSGGTTGIPIWSPSGDRILFVSNSSGVADLFQKTIAGNEQPEALLRNEHMKLPTQWTRDGQYVVYNERDPKTHMDLWVLPMNGAAAQRKPVLFLGSEFEEQQGQISPDDKWMAFISNRSGRFEVYIRPFPQPAGEWAVSVGGGYQPRWRADGKEIYWIGGDLKMMAASVKVNTTKVNAAKVNDRDKPSLEIGVPQPLFQTRIMQTSGGVFDYDVTADGKRFLIADRIDAGPTPLTLVTNWNAGLK